MCKEDEVSVFKECIYLKRTVTNAETKQNSVTTQKRISFREISLATERLRSERISSKVVPMLN
jgi:hypothetical protein